MSTQNETIDGKRYSRYEIESAKRISIERKIPFKAALIIIRRQRPKMALIVQKNRKKRSELRKLRK